MKIPLFGKVDLRQENKGLEHHFWDKKSPNGTMLKSSVKHNGKCYAFLTKSDKMATCRFGVENITFWTTSPVSVFRTYYQFLAKKASSKALFFLSQINMCPFCHFGSEKPILFLGVCNTFQHVIIL